MNATHGVAIGGGAVLVSPLTNVFMAWHVPAPADTATLVVAVLGGLYAYVAWKWPKEVPAPPVAP